MVDRYLSPKFDVNSFGGGGYGGGRGIRENDVYGRTTY